jgi:lipopolysaccharide transport system permease protein
MSETVIVYTPDSSLAAPRKMVAAMFSDLSRSRQMAWRLAVRDIRAQYRQAFLGLLWAFIGPLATTVTWIFLNQAGIVSPGQTSLPYPAFVLTGALLWSILIDAMNSPLHHTNAARGMLAKLNFPREAILLSGIYQLLFNTGIKIALMLGALLAMGIYPGWGLLLFPLGVASLVLVGTALGLLITPVGLLYSDVGRGVPLLMSFMMYLTPVVFPVPKDGWVATLYQINPLSPLILTSRDWITGQTPEFLGYFAAVNVAAFCLLLVVWVAYRLAMPIIIERMSA